MKLLIVMLGLMGMATAGAEEPRVLQPEDVPAVVVSPGVILHELMGRTAPAAARTDRCSVALFHLEPGRASAWSFNRVGEESFFVLKGRGEIRLGKQTLPVRAGSYVLVPPAVVRSIRASADEALEFYAITAPSWSAADDVLTESPQP